MVEGKPAQDARILMVAPRLDTGDQSNDNCQIVPQITLIPEILLRVKASRALFFPHTYLQDGPLALEGFTVFTGQIKSG